jgi:hypothetical protein
MWLKDDLEQLKQNWKQSPWWVRLWMAVSLSLAVSSLASLSETVAQWKGFFLDAIEFYRNWLSGPLRDFAAAHGVRYTSQRADGMLLFLIIFSSYIRAVAVYTDWSKRGDRGFFWFVVLTTFVAFSFAFYSGANNDAVLNDSFLWFGLAISLGIGVLQARHNRAVRLTLFQIAIVMMVVGTLGAISSGLSKDG